MKHEQISREVLHFWKWIFLCASTKPLPKMQNNQHETPTLTNFCNTSEAILRFRKSAWRYCLELQKSAFGSESVVFLKRNFQRRSKNAVLQTAIPLGRNAWFIMLLQYLSYDLGHSNVPSLTSGALPTSQVAILAEKCCIHRESALSSSRRLPTSFGGPLGFLRAFF